jgi:hypothetical protein
MALLGLEGALKHHHHLCQYLASQQTHFSAGSVCHRLSHFVFEMFMTCGELCRYLACQQKHRWLLAGCDSLCSKYLQFLVVKKIRCAVFFLFFIFFKMCCFCWAFLGSNVPHVCAQSVCSSACLASSHPSAWSVFCLVCTVTA